MNIEQPGPRYLIIPAAGLGTRMRAVNSDVPKELLPVGYKPAIQYAVEEGVSAGIINIIIIISKPKDVIRRYFEERRFGKKLYPYADKSVQNIMLKSSLTFLYQKDPRGESDAIGYAKDIVGNNSAAIMYPDNLYFPAPGALKALVPFFNKYKKDVVSLNKVTEKNASGFSNAGRVDITQVKENLYNINRFIPKGDGQFVPRFKGEFRACGIWISGPYIFEYIDRLRGMVKEGEFTDVPVRSLILKEKGMLGCLLPGTIFDIGNPAGYNQCLNMLRDQNEPEENQLF